MWVRYHQVKQFVRLLIFGWEFGINAATYIISLFFLFSAGTMLFSLIWETSLQELVPEEKFGRVADLDMLGSFALLPVGYLLTGWFAEGIGEIFTLFIFGIVIVLISGITISIRGIRTFN